MTQTKEALDAYRAVRTNEIYARNLYLTGSQQVGGNLVVTGSISGSTYQGLEFSSTNLTVNNLTVTGSGGFSGSLAVAGSFTAGTLTNTGSVVVSGSLTAGSIIVTGSISGSSVQGELMGKTTYDTNLDGVVDNSALLEGLTATQVRTHAPASHGDSHTSGSGDATTIYRNQISDIQDLDLTIPGLTVTGSSNITGSSIFGDTVRISGSLSVDASVSLSGSLTATGSISGSSYLGPLVNATNVVATNITGSTLISGSDFRGPTATFTNINVTNITGSLLSGSQIRGPDAVITSVSATDVVAANITGSTQISGSSFIGGSITVTNITGSSLVSGSDFRSPTATITNINATNITGSTVSGSNLYGPNANITTITSTNVTTTNVTGSSIVSGSSLYGKDAIITNVTSTNITGSTVSGSTYQGTLVTGFAKSGSSLLVGGVYLQEGTNITLTQSGQYIEIISAATGSGTGSVMSDTVTSEITFGQSALAGTATTSMRGDHTHGTPSLSNVNAYDIADTPSSGSINTGSKVDHVHRGILSVASSGSSDLYSRVYFTGSGTVSASQTGQGVYVSGSTAPTFSSLTVNGAISGSEILGTNITGSSNISGSNIYGANATITNINATNITGSIISGSTIKGTTQIIHGPTTLSGSLYVTGSTEFDQTIGQLKSGSYYGGAETASYIIWSGSGQYWVKNGSTGLIFTSGSDAAIVIQAAINALTYGGKIFFKQGLYNIANTTLTVPYNKSIEIVGEGSVPNYPTYANPECVYISYTGTGYAIDTSGTGQEVADIVIRQIAIQLNSDHYSGGIHLVDFNSGRLEYVKVIGGWQTLPSTSKGFYIEGVTPNIITFEFCCALGPLEYGFYFATDHLHFYNCFSLQNEYGFYGTEGKGQGNIYVDCNAEISTYRGFRLWCYNTLIAPYIEGITDATGIGIELKGGYSYVVNNPYFTDMVGGSQKMVWDTGAKVKVLGTNFLTENKGYTSIYDSSGSFAHGLAIVPSFVSLSVSGSIPLETSWYLSGSAGVWVYHNGTPPVGIYWKAEA